MKFSVEKLQNRPRFSDILRPIEVKFFSQILDTVWGVGFFRFKNIALVSSGRFHKFVLIEKQAFFYGVSHIFDFLI